MLGVDTLLALTTRRQALVYVYLRARAPFPAVWLPVLGLFSFFSPFGRGWLLGAFGIHSVIFDFSHHHLGSSDQKKMEFLCSRNGREKGRVGMSVRLHGLGSCRGDKKDDDEVSSCLLVFGFITLFLYLGFGSLFDDCHFLSFLLPI